jgi:hypothetical protein
LNKVAIHEHGVGPLARKRSESRINLAAGAGIEDLELQRHGARGRFQFSHRCLGFGRIARIDEHGYTLGGGHQLPQQPKPF